MRELFNILGGIGLFAVCVVMWTAAMDYELVRNWIPVIAGTLTFFFFIWLSHSLKKGTFNDDVQFFFTGLRRTQCPKCYHEFKG